MADQNIPLGNEPKLKAGRKGTKEQFKEGPEGEKVPMTKEETIAFYEENIPFMRKQEEYEALAFSFQERKIQYLELQVRELQAIGYLAEWKAGQDEARNRQAQEEKMRAEWDAMTPEQQEVYRKKAQENLAELEKQAESTKAL